ncbi:hypothetical protein LINPERHAP1_LOCUS39124 [Linum perenne]
MKLGWEILNNPNKLWVRVITCKYLKEMNSGQQLRRHFLWLIAHDWMLTNVEHRKRHLEADVGCQRCMNLIEDTLHVVRDCRVAREDWLQKGLQHEDFSLTFGIIIRILWKARNETVFENNLVTCDQLRL